jgi:predicted double-glycine peptidase
MSGSDYERLFTQKSASLSDMRRAFESNGFYVETYDVDPVDFRRAVASVIRRASEISGVLILLIIDGESTQSVRVGHYMVVQSIDGDSILMTEPSHGGAVSMSLTQPRNSDLRIVAQVVSGVRPPQQILFASWIVLLIALSIVMFLPLPRWSFQR